MKVAISSASRTRRMDFLNPAFSSKPGTVRSGPWHYCCRLVRSKPFHRAGLFAFRTLRVFDARAVLIAFSAALILASRLTSWAGKFKAKLSLASARFKRSAFLVSEIGWPMLLPYRKTMPRASSDRVRSNNALES